MERLGKLTLSEKDAGSGYLAGEANERIEEKARRIICEYLDRANMEKETFLGLKKGDPHKVQLARELRKQTTMSMAWIAKELNAGVPQTLWRALWEEQQKGDNTRD